MKKNESIEKIMSKDVVSGHVGMKISEIRKLMLDNDCHHCPIVSGDELVGLLSASDILAISVKGVGTDQRSMDAYLDHQFSVEDQMVKDVRTIGADTTVRDAAEALSDGKFHALPVIDKDKKLVGIVTTTDLINYLCDLY